MSDLEVSALPLAADLVDYSVRTHGAVNPIVLVLTEPFWDAWEQHAGALDTSLSRLVRCAVTLEAVERGLVKGNLSLSWVKPRPIAKKLTVEKLREEGTAQHSDRTQRSVRMSPTLYQVMKELAGDRSVCGWFRAFTERRYAPATVLDEINIRRAA
jgi:predicted DNA-binding ribbon-helix-helix protein